mmetsp:Transcript_7712/g.15472  ORF Transcript_7712/g.15472 Transcript_7712/m.15472 type:complete len:279 (+) Transcript_7712:316-1152(+)|eukprot:scaffold3591_cov159-Amphora_coffeaeformis.AAC.14
MSATMERQPSCRRMQGKPRSSRNLANSAHHIGGSFRRFPTKEVTRLPSFRGNPMAPCCPPNLEEVGRLKSFRQQAMRKQGSLRKVPSFRKLESSFRLDSSFKFDSSRNLDVSRKLESFRQVSIRQLDPQVFSQIANASLSSSSRFGFSLDTTESMMNSFAESCHGPISTIEFRPDEEGEFETIEIEIAPGIFKRLKGSIETQAAWDNDECVEAMCFVCDSVLAVAPGCDSVICPNCHSISPVFSDESDAQSVDSFNCSWWLSLDDKDAVGLGILIPDC